MIAKCPCQQCGTNIEFEIENDGEFIDCPACGKQTRLLLPVAQRISEDDHETYRQELKSTFKTKTGKSAKGAAAKEHLKLIRSESCYPHLRTIINVCFALLVIGVCIYAVIILWIPLSFGNWSAAALTICGVVVGSIIAVIVLIALRQSALLLIDIADTLLNEHAMRGIEQTRN
jgi:rRNA maturation protein Nop10